MLISYPDTPIKVGVGTNLDQPHMLIMLQGRNRFTLVKLLQCSLWNSVIISIYPLELWWLLTFRVRSTDDDLGRKGVFPTQPRHFRSLIPGSFISLQGCGTWPLSSAQTQLKVHYHRLMFLTYGSGKDHAKKEKVNINWLSSLYTEP